MKATPTDGACLLPEPNLNKVFQSATVVEITWFNIDLVSRLSETIQSFTIFGQSDQVTDVDVSSPGVLYRVGGTLGCNVTPSETGDSSL